MPIFRGINCWWKFTIFMIAFAAVSITIMVGLSQIIGFFAGIVIIGLLMMILYFIIDLYGDPLLSEKGHWFNKEEQKAAKFIKLNYPK